VLFAGGVRFCWRSLAIALQVWAAPLPRDAALLLRFARVLFRRGAAPAAGLDAAQRFRRGAAAAMCW